MNTAPSANPPRQPSFRWILALVVGIVVLAVGALGIFKLVRASKISTEASNITQIATNLENMKDGANGYAGMNTEMAVRLHVFPLNMTQSPDGTVRNSWGGAVTVGPATGNISHYVLAYAGVPQEACQQLALKLRTAGWARMTIGGTPIDKLSTVSHIGTACGDQAAGNELVFENG